MNIQMSEKKILGVVCICLMILCGRDVYANDTNSATVETSAANISRTENKFEFDKEAIHKHLQQALSEELALVNSETEQEIAQSLTQVEDDLRYALLLPKRFFPVGPAVVELSVVEEKADESSLEG